MKLNGRILPSEEWSLAFMREWCDLLDRVYKAQERKRVKKKRVNRT